MFILVQNSFMLQLPYTLLKCNGTLFQSFGQKYQLSRSLKKIYFIYTSYVVDFCVNRRFLFLKKNNKSVKKSVFRGLKYLLLGILSYSFLKFHMQLRFQELCIAFSSAM
jgi:hypothetical protein